MNRDDIIRMAREAHREELEDLMYRAGLTAQGCWDSMDQYDREAIMNFAALVAAAEREACLALVTQGTGEATSADALKILRMERDRISAAIRARGE